ncbi:MAG: VTT domain-containing protein [Gammaproteobacteria bacterium]|nr:VTT domain-containing protein [Gammaproteobacteria bacterium]
MDLIDFILHVDRHLLGLIGQYGLWVYGILFLIVFVETGVVVMPFLPGDSLLFAAGALAGVGSLDPLVLAGCLFVAATLGDSCNYYVGSRIGAAVYARDSRWIRRDHLDRAREFFERHGGKSVVIARFAPFLRTFVPFVAGASHMSYARFLMFNILGALFWVGGFVGLGYFFGNLPGVKEHFTWVLLGIIVLSLLPALVAYLQGRRPAAGGVRR